MYLCVGESVVCVSVSVCFLVCMCHVDMWLCVYEIVCGVRVQLYVCMVCDCVAMYVVVCGRVVYGVFV